MEGEMNVQRRLRAVTRKHFAARALSFAVARNEYAAKAMSFAVARIECAATARSEACAANTRGREEGSPSKAVA